jgi:hypothetical protein
VGAKYFDKACQTSVDPNITGTPPTFGIGDTVAMTMGGARIQQLANIPWVSGSHPIGSSSSIASSSTKYQPVR